jgi:hypothetical protein
MKFVLYFGDRLVLRQEFHVELCAGGGDMLAVVSSFGDRMRSLELW